MDVAVIGGGVAGLWSAAVIAKHGYSVLLVERDALGAGQTIASQGILHGGIKYTLSGAATTAAKAVAGMPARWHAAMTRLPEADLELDGVVTLCPAQYLWTTGSIFGRITAKVAATAIRTAVRSVAPADACEGLRGAPTGISIHQVDEPVIEPRSLVASLKAVLERHGGVTVKGDAVLGMVSGERVVRLAAGTVGCTTLVLSAGAGNEPLVAALRDGPRMQRRPLHMVMARGRLPAVYGHCVAALSDKPRLTVTTQVDSSGRTVWYIGGRIAEEGVQRDAAAQIAAAKDEVRACLPWIGLNGTQWATVRIDRAEGATGEGVRPDIPTITEQADGHGVAVTVWPTKLVFAPFVGSELLRIVRRQPPGNRDGLESIRNAHAGAPIADLPWERPEVVWN